MARTGRVPMKQPAQIVLVIPIVFVVVLEFLESLISDQASTSTFFHLLPRFSGFFAISRFFGRQPPALAG
jgi:hypothetical protein